jgi:hypothetical protein
VEHSNKISVLTSRTIDEDEVINESGKKPYYGYVEENIITFHKTMYLMKYSRMNRMFNIKIDQLIQSGIVQRLVKAQFSNSTRISQKQREEESQEENAEQLIMEHLELCFYAILICLALSCVVFGCEVWIGLKQR